MGRLNDHDDMRSISSTPWRGRGQMIASVTCTAPTRPQSNQCDARPPETWPGHSPILAIAYLSEAITPPNSNKTTEI